MINLTSSALMAPGSDEILSDAPGATVRRTVLPSGVRVLTEQVTGMRSVAFGAWINVGSRHETDGHYGSTHFLEHLLFKGTPSRTALDIAAAFDGVGGDANAMTAKEYTCYYARVLDHDAPMAIEVIMDMITSSLLDSDEFESERQVILEELAMSQDDPTEVASDAFSAAVFGDHPLGRPIGGTPETINAVPRDAVWEHYQETYGPQTLVITAAGGVDHYRLVEQVEAALHRGGWNDRVASQGGQLGPAHSESSTQQDSPAQRGNRAGQGTDSQGLATTAVNELYLVRPIEQAHVLLGGRGIKATDDRRFAMSILNGVLGGSMSSRLFQEIREKRGLAYSVYSFALSYQDAGNFAVYAGCLPQKVPAVVEIIQAELARIASEPISDAELRLAIGQARGGTVLSQEDSSSRMGRLGRSELMMGSYLTIDEALQRIENVTASEVQSIAAELVAQANQLVVVGPQTPRE